MKDQLFSSLVDLRVLPAAEDWVCACPGER